MVVQFFMIIFFISVLNKLAVELLPGFKAKLQQFSHLVKSSGLSPSPIKPFLALA